MNNGKGMTASGLIFSIDGSSNQRSSGRGKYMPQFLNQLCSQEGRAFYNKPIPHLSIDRKQTVYNLLPQPLSEGAESAQAMLRKLLEP